MMTMKKQFILILLSLLTALALAACGGNGDDAETPNPTTEGGAEAREILDSSLLAMSQLENFQSDLTLEFSGESAGTVDMQVFVKGSFLAAGSERPQFKGVVTESDLPSIPAGTVAILGPTSYVYDPVQNVTLVSEAGGEVPQAYSEIYSLFLGNQTRAVTLMSPDVTNPTIEAENVAVGDFQTTQIALNPTDTTSIVMAPGAQGTVWIDQDSNLPVKLEYTEDGFGVTWTANTLSLEPLDDAVFEPGDDIPADANQVAGDELAEVTEVASLDEAMDQAGFTSLVPSYLPEGLPTEPSSIGVQETSLGNAIVQNYASTTEAEADAEITGALEDVNPVETNSIVINALQSDVGLPDTPIGTVSEVTVRGQTGTLAVIGDGQVTLEWSEDGVIYTISSNGYGENEVLQVAEGLE
jgi:hypothetical protein